MPLIHDPDQVQSPYAQATDSGICLANFYTSNPCTTESILCSALEFAQLHPTAPAPIIVSATGRRYPTEPQLEAYTSTRSASLGMRSLVDDVRALVAPGSPLERVGAQAVARFVLRELGGILEQSELRDLETEGWIGHAHFTSGRSIGPTLEFLRESARRDVWQAAFVARMKQYLTHFGYARWTGGTS